jgi:hypothetical protein
MKHAFVRRLMKHALVRRSMKHAPCAFPMKHAILAMLVLCAITFARPHVVERWALYLGAAHGPRPAQLFLDPFPSAASCESRVLAFAANGERAFCASHRELEFGTAADETLAADFNPLLPASWRCAPRRPVLAERAGPPHYPNVRMILGAPRPIVAR